MTRYTSKRPNPQHRPYFATPRSGHITMPRPNSSLARQWGNITMPHLGNTLARHPDSTQAPRPSNTLALHRVNPAPRQIHPRSASGPQRPNTVSGSTPVPHRAHNIPAMGPIAATGQIPRKCAEHHDQQSKIRNKKGARHADASRKTNSAEIYASLAPYCS